MTNKRKPGGLQKSLKKQKGDTEQPEIGEETLVIEVSGKNEVEELEQLYESGIAELLNNKNEQAILIFRGVIHECDKMIRIRHGKVPNATAEEIELLQKAAKDSLELPSKFYLCYGNSLYHLSLLEKDEDSKSFLETALEIVEKAFSMDKGPLTSYTLARILIQLQSVQGNEEQRNKFKELMNSLKSSIADSQNLENFKELAQYCQVYCDKLSDPSEKKNWANYCIEIWDSILTYQERDIDALIGTGNVWLGMADDELQVNEDNVSQESVIEIQKMLERGNLFLIKQLINLIWQWKRF
jgi:tetratricopeptide (TPR) repeat protein